MQWTDTRYLSDIKGVESSRTNIPGKQEPHVLLKQQGGCRHTTRVASSPCGALVRVSGLGFVLH